MYRFTSERSLGLRQLHPAPQVTESGIGTHIGPEWVGCEIGHPTPTLLVTLFEPPEGRILVAQSGIKNQAATLIEGRRRRARTNR